MNLIKIDIGKSIELSIQIAVIGYLFKLYADEQPTACVCVTNRIIQSVRTNVKECANVDRWNLQNRWKSNIHSKREKKNVEMQIFTWKDSACRISTNVTKWTKCKNPFSQFITVCYNVIRFVRAQFPPFLSRCCYLCHIFRLILISFTRKISTKAHLIAPLFTHTRTRPGAQT